MKPRREIRFTKSVHKRGKELAGYQSGNMHKIWQLGVELEKTQ